MAFPTTTHETFTPDEQRALATHCLEVEGRKERLAETGREDDETLAMTVAPRLLQGLERFALNLVRRW